MEVCGDLQGIRDILKNRSEARCMLHTVAQASSLPWCCIGDYNDLLAYGEK